MTGYYVGLVGSSKAGNLAYDQIKDLVLKLSGADVDPYCKVVFISGGGKGVDTTAREVCKDFDMNFVEYKPEGWGWAYLKKRDMLIAENCDKVYSFALPFGTTIKNGEPIPKCYHCKRAGRDDNHEKTAGCYTGRMCASQDGNKINVVPQQNHEADWGTPDYETIIIKV